MTEKALTNEELFARYGDPSDPNDPRHWKPTTRLDKGLSLSDRVKLLEIDMELMQLTVGSVLKWAAIQQEKELLQELKTNPRAAMEKLAKILGQEIPEDIQEFLAGAKGPSDGATLYAGSVQGAPADALVITPTGTIRVDQIPGYKNDPDWTPSTDWVDMNCLCESHVAIRENNAIDLRFNELTGEQ